MRQAKMELEVGMKVRLKNRRGLHWNSAGLMDCYKGKVVTVSKVFTEYVEGIKITKFNIFEDNHPDHFTDNRYNKWNFRLCDIEEVVDKTTIEDIMKARGLLADVYEEQAIRILASSPRMTFADIINDKKNKKEMKELRKIIEDYKVTDVIKQNKDGVPTLQKKVTVYFKDCMDCQSVVCMLTDEFDLVTGIEKCILKHLYGQDAKGQIKAIIKEKEDKIAKEKKEKEEMEKLEALRKAKKEKKLKKWRERKAKMKAQEIKDTISELFKLIDDGKLKNKLEALMVEKAKEEKTEMDYSKEWKNFLDMFVKAPLKNPSKKKK